ncbi:hypothetical protein FA09DRAFT_328034 [Tilletiopsis washingtonensis]|uniref:DUF431-domain-containing protein n=1 Tax=Tilletiopsis washingtonensis TaxID=58919 RepID=A0A316ZJZ9_9BASI|nr:hypothetical protein FA09DRAFT_328034 [Tilletiopsis washingtonensis]PWO00624.1 hypothetical protein FA09DRAFT_328034 [Tilletiopsis washingtonensis]
MEDDEPAGGAATFPAWALLEYAHMLTLLGPGTTCHFTALSRASLAALVPLLDAVPQPRADFACHAEAFDVLAPLRDVCLLDPQAPHALSVRDAGLHAARQAPAQGSSADAGAADASASSTASASTTAAPAASVPDGPFTHFLFGGILGDDPPRDRTAALRLRGPPRRHLGAMQMTTDTALGVTSAVVEHGRALALADTEQHGPGGACEWVDAPELHFGRGESVSMPFRYLLDPAPAPPRAKDAGQRRPLMPPGMRELIRSDLDRAFEF